MVSGSLLFWRRSRNQGVHGLEENMNGLMKMYWSCLEEHVLKRQRTRTAMTYGYSIAGSRG